MASAHQHAAGTGRGVPFQYCRPANGWARRIRSLELVWFRGSQRFFGLPSVESMNSMSQRPPQSPLDTQKAGADSTAVVVAGLGAVSPAGWGLKSLQAALASGQALPTKELARPGWMQTLQVRPVPPQPTRSAHAR